MAAAFLLSEYVTVRVAIQRATAIDSTMENFTELVEAWNVVYNKHAGMISAPLFPLFLTTHALYRI